MFLRVMAVADEDGGRAWFSAGHGFPSPGGDDRWVLTVVVPMPWVLPHHEEVAVAVEPIVA